ncbi:hypothetical protein ABS71_09100 [bacterium SCN 62-11]|nr:MAG: hypothetical protein ABS71_09100 [bacterium SCN 62-11]
MTKFTILPALAATVLLLSPAAFANHLSGTVHHTDRNGVYVTNPNGMTYVPSNSATFRVGNAVVGLPGLSVGSRVNASYNNGWNPQYVPQAYYQQNPNYSWNQHVNGWKTDRHNWQNNNGHWSRRNQH